MHALQTSVVWSSASSWADPAQWQSKNNEIVRTWRVTAAFLIWTIHAIKPAITSVETTDTPSAFHTTELRWIACWSAYDHRKKEWRLNRMLLVSSPSPLSVTVTVTTTVTATTTHHHRHHHHRHRHRHHRHRHHHRHHHHRHRHHPSSPSPSPSSSPPPSPSPSSSSSPSPSFVNWIIYNPNE